MRPLPREATSGGSLCSPCRGPSQPLPGPAFREPRSPGWTSGPQGLTPALNPPGLGVGPGLPHWACPPLPPGMTNVAAWVWGWGHGRSPFRSPRQMPVLSLPAARFQPVFVLTLGGVYLLLWRVNKSPDTTGASLGVLGPCGEVAYSSLQPVRSPQFCPHDTHCVPGCLGSCLA